ncbi:MAG: hypothetical protein AAFY17_17275 [Cyanobacteria bacterium J06642_11]
MPDHSFPDASPPEGGHSTFQSFVTVDEKIRFTPTVDPMQQSWGESWPQLLNEYQPGVNSLLRPLTFHADPLTPLRQRDELALEEIFGDSYQMAEVVDDIRGRLGQLHPEPCWEDEPFNFLKGYL